MDDLTWPQLLRFVTEEVGDSVIARRIIDDVSGAVAPWEDLLVSEAQYSKVMSHVTELWKGRPLQYVLGHWQFRSLDLCVDERVLVPRPETEMVAQAVIDRVHNNDVVVDLGTGSGAIALSIAHECHGAEVWATDSSREALDVARVNAMRLGIAVRFAEGDWYGALPLSLRGEVSCIVANPPYVADNDFVEPIVREHEPHDALFAGLDGLDAIRVIVAQASQWLRDDGVLVVELAPSQAEAVRKLAYVASFANAEIGQDLTGRDRFLIASR